MVIRPGGWHLPYADVESFEKGGMSGLIKVCVARCARISYRAFDGTTVLFEQDVQKHDDLRDAGHWSPFEHVAQSIQEGDYRSGNFVGWHQYRQFFQARQCALTFDFDRLDAFPMDWMPDEPMERWCFSDALQRV
jgi:hypothetical protein